MAGEVSIEQVVLQIRADIGDLKAKLGDAQRSTSQVASGMNASWKSVAQGVGVVVAAYAAMQKLMRAGSGAIADAKERIEAERKLSQALGYTSTALLRRAAAVQKTTTFSDDEVVSAQALVAAYVKEEDQIAKLMPAIEDLAAAKGIDLRTAADQVTKAIAGSAGGLGRYGIKVTESKDRTVRLNDIVTKVTAAYGGMAEAIGATDVGKLEQQKNALQDMSEELGLRIIPYQIEWNKLIIETLEGWGHIYKQVVQFLGLGKDQTFIAGMTHQRDVAFENARMYGEQVTKLKLWQAEGQKMVDVTVNGQKKKLAIEEAIAEFESKQRQNTAIGGRAAQQLAATSEYANPDLSKRRKTPSPIGDEEDRAKAAAKAEAARIAQQLAEYAAATAQANAEIELSLEALDSLYASGTVTLEEYYKTKRSLTIASADEEMNAILLRMGVEKDAAKQTELESQYQVKKIELTKALTVLDREHAEAIKKKTEETERSTKESRKQNEANEKTVRGIERTLLDQSYQSYTQYLAKRLAALKAEQAEEIATLHANGATQAQIDRANAAHTQQQTNTSTQATTEYYSNLLGAASSAAQQISSIYGEYYDMVRTQEQQRIDAEVEGARARGASEEELGKLRASLADEGNARAKEAWEKQKQADIASAIIGTALATVNALQTKPFYVGLIMAGLAVAAGAVQIAKIRSQTYPGLAEGGMIHMGTTSTADDVPARLSRGEFVSPANSVAYYGSGVYEALRQRALPRDMFAGVTGFSARRGSGGFALGGMPSTVNAGAAKQSDVTVVNFLDQSLVDRFLASPRGQRAMVNAIQARSYDVNKALG